MLCTNRTPIIYGINTILFGVKGLTKHVFVMKAKSFVKYSGGFLGGKANVSKYSMY